MNTEQLDAKIASGLEQISLMQRKNQISKIVWQTVTDFTEDFSQSRNSFKFSPESIVILCDRLIERLIETHNA